MAKLSTLLLLLACFAAAVLPVAAGKPKEATACWKDAEDRGRGVIPDKGKCADGLEKSAGLCYHKCPSDMKGLGPLCWDQCKSPLSVSALFFCCKDEDECTELVSVISRKLPEALIKFGIDIAVNPGNILGILRELRELVHDTLEISIPLCKKLGHESADAPPHLAGGSVKVEVA